MSSDRGRAPNLVIVSCQCIRDAHIYLLKPCVAVKMSSTFVQLELYEKQLTWIFHRMIILMYKRIWEWDAIVQIGDLQSDLITITAVLLLCRNWRILSSDLSPYWGQWDCKKEQYIYSAESFWWWQCIICIDCLSPGLAWNLMVASTFS